MHHAMYSVARGRWCWSRLATRLVHLANLQPRAIRAHTTMSHPSTENDKGPYIKQAAARPGRERPPAPHTDREQKKEETEHQVCLHVGHEAKNARGRGLLGGHLWRVTFRRK